MLKMLKLWLSSLLLIPNISRQERRKKKRGDMEIWRGNFTLFTDMVVYINSPREQIEELLKWFIGMKE